MDHMQNNRNPHFPAPVQLPAGITRDMQPVITTLLDDSLASIGYPKGTHVVALPAENIWDGELMLAYDEMEESLVGHIFDSGLIDDRIKLTWPDGSEESFDRIELTVYGPVVGALGR